MKLEKIRVDKQTRSGSDWDAFLRPVWVHSASGGQVKLSITLPTGVGSSHFTINLKREDAKAVARAIEDSFEDHVNVVDKTQDRLMARIKKLEEAQEVEEIL